MIVSRRNIPSGEVTMQELLTDVSRVPGSLGAYLQVKPGEGIHFSDLAQLTINHNGVEFLLSREVEQKGNQVTRRWRIYSGTSDEVDPPSFFVPSAPGGGIRIERTVGHTHPRPIPYDPTYTQPSFFDLKYLIDITLEWQKVYGAHTEPFGRIIWGLHSGETTIYGLASTSGYAVLPTNMRKL